MRVKRKISTKSKRTIAAKQSSVPGMAALDMTAETNRIGEGVEKELVVYKPVETH